MNAFSHSKKGPIFKDKRCAAVAACLVGLAAFATYMGNRMPLPSGDTVPGRLLPISMLVEHDLDMDEFYHSILPAKRYCMIGLHGRRLSSYPLGAAFTALPIYAAAAWFSPGIFTVGMEAFFNTPYGNASKTSVPSRMEDLSAALLTALSVVGIWLLARIRLPFWPSVLVTLAYGWGTTVASSASQALWSHTPSCLALVFMLLLLMLPHAHWGILCISGALAGWAFFSRATNAIAIAMLGPWIILRFRERHRWIGFAIGLTAVLVATTCLNMHLYGHILGGALKRSQRMGMINPTALAGLLFSPSRGLLVYSPFLFLSILMGAFLLAKGFWNNLAGSCLLSVIASLMLYAAWPDWGGGFSFGPRILTDIVPFMMVPIIEGTRQMGRNRIWVGLISLLVLLSIPIHMVGIYCGDGGWNATIYREQRGPELWNIKDSQFVWALRDAWRSR